MAESTLTGTSGIDTSIAIYCSVLSCRFILRVLFSCARALDAEKLMSLALNFGFLALSATFWTGFNLYIKFPSHYLIRIPFAMNSITSRTVLRRSFAFAYGARLSSVARVLPVALARHGFQVMSTRKYASGSPGGGGGGFPGLSFGSQHQKGDALKEYVSCTFFHPFFKPG